MDAVVKPFGKTDICDSVQSFYRDLEVGLMKNSVQYNQLLQSVADKVKRCRIKFT